MGDPSDRDDSGSGAGSFRLSDVVEQRDDLRDVREVLKQAAAAQRDAGQDTKVSDMVALAPKNDTAYIRPADIEKAEWFAEIYESEGRPEIHPRGLHYLIFPKDYETRNGEKYQNTTKCYQELKEGAYWAQLLGLVDADRIGDERSKSPTHYGLPSRERADESQERLPRELAHDIGEFLDPDDGIDSETYHATLEPATLDHGSVEAYIESEVGKLIDTFFSRIRYRQQYRQDYHIEIWCEKANIIPSSVAKEVGATVRETGGGEMTFQMCRDAIQIASARDQDLAVVVVSDFDPKGADMPKSAARKLEVESVFHSAEVEVRHAAVTLEQVRRHGIPGMPAKKPRGLEHGNRGAKGYETHTELFREYAGQHPVEIRAFSARYPDDFEEAIRESVMPYHDPDLQERIVEAVDDAEQDARDELLHSFRESRDDIDDARDDVAAALGRYHDEIEDDIDKMNELVENLQAKDTEVRERHRLDEQIDALQEAILDVDVEEALLGVDVEVPEPQVSAAEDPLLDSRRDYLSQLRAYREFDPRTDD